MTNQASVCVVYATRREAGNEAARSLTGLRSHIMAIPESDFEVAALLEPRQIRREGDIRQRMLQLLDEMEEALAAHRWT
jgi:vacuolar-type H+-ATPase subunit I/STV1